MSFQEDMLKSIADAIREREIDSTAPISASDFAQRIAAIPDKWDPKSYKIDHMQLAAYGNYLAEQHLQQQYPQCSMFRVSEHNNPLISVSASACIEDSFETKRGVIFQIYGHVGELVQARDASGRVYGTISDAATNLDFAFKFPMTSECMMKFLGPVKFRVPAQSGSLTANGSPQSPKWDRTYGSEYVSTGGTISATEPGDYYTTFTLLAPDFAWSDGTTEPKTVKWTIRAAS